MQGNTQRQFEESPEQTAELVLQLVKDLVDELRQGQQPDTPLQLDCQFDQDLGFDSLARAELIQRTEKQFSVSLPDQTLASIETPRDLVRELLQATHTGDVSVSELLIEQIQLDVVESAPEHVHTLQEVLDWHVNTHPDRPHLYVYQNADQVTEISYRMIQEKARQIANGLIKQDIAPGECVAIMLPTSNDYFYSFFGILYARAIPVPIYPPARPSQIEDHLKRHANILQNAEARLLITVPEAKPLSQLLRMQVPSIKAVVTVSEIMGSTAPPDVGDAHTSDIAFLQYTSGSTGIPKGVALTHANLLTNIRAMGKVVKASSSDVFISWLPVYHDMGLIGTWFGSLYYASPLVIMSPLLFLSKPQRWLWAIHRHRGTVSPAPNFAYELCINKIDESELEGLDLSSWRLAWNGAEPVSPSTIARFTERFAKYGFRPETMSPVYGLAESSVGLTFPTEIRTPRIERIKREPMTRFGRAETAGSDDPDAMQVVGLGLPLPGHQIRIMDDLGRELPEREEGELEFKGASATAGYYRDPEKTKLLYHGDWLNTGDRAFTIGGELFLTGRSKDIIIRAGRNIYPHELEEAVSKVPGIRKGCVAAFASHDSRTGTERLIVLAESRETDTTKQQELKHQINNLALDLLGSLPDDVVIGLPHTVPKTSSGKIRRAACKELYEQDSLDVRQRAVWWQTLRLMTAGITPQLRRYWRMTLDVGYAAYMWLMMAILASIVWSFVAVVPNRDWCWRITRTGARALIRLTGTKLTIKGKEHLPDPDCVSETPCILVANHASYLDGLVMVAATQLKCRFVAKSELKKNFFARLFLSKLDTEFVERFDAEKGILDAKRIADSAHSSQPLFFFPEGTLYRMAGLHEFHMGAFTAAADAGLPVLPVTLCGTRSKLRDRSLFPRRGNISVTISPLIYPQGNDWNAALKLRDQARSEILRHCGEPDLAHSKNNR
ncbi:AMP-binding protein [Photobacterium alginatilyticum]|uniref:Acyl-phosphate glycerol 3-phosphate acyltransferase n=1 Tax=Photobacterium alginatilyticum TaxID=1775171 RepID=A0ABW9YHE8_9GAMM|nr:AMP-binding protein [Photobacterium alginatilyticum]NBI53249.1 acyl-phosphate glycerol 3-phosphate acyltransferase [Photobacterium alginatilyticum]